MAGVVPDLQLGKRLGNGHFGVVYLGQDSVHGRVAVKVLAKKSEHSDAEWQGYKAGFLAEAQNLSKATHRNVVQVYHIQELPGGNSIRFCMAFCPGGSLQSAFEAGPMSLPAVRKAGTEMLMGLNALHARQMLHRDIKPGNVLIDADGVAQIGDSASSPTTFYSATVRKPATSTISLTRFGMARERARGPTFGRLG